MAKLVLFDGHSLAYRAFFALPPDMATKSGELTNATFGFTSMVLDVLERERPDYVAVAFDVGKTWRHDRYTEYKGHRLKAPSEMHPQVERIKEIVQAFNIPIFTARGWEADDVLATLARQAAEQDIDVLIVTSDTDAHQLVNDRITVLSSTRYFKETKLYNVAAIEERYGLKTSQLIDYKALLGDKSDNIPGVAGIGEKTAATMLQQYGSLEGIYDHLDELKPGVRKKLEEGRKSAFISKELGTIDKAVPGITLDLDACRARDFDRQQVFELFRELQFTSLVDRIPAPETERAAPRPAQPEIETCYETVDTEEKLDELVAAVQASNTISLDTETNDLDPIRARMVGLVVGVGPGRSYYVPVNHRIPITEGQLTLEREAERAEPRNLPLELVRERLNPLLARPELTIYAHNAKFDMEILLGHGFTIAPVDHDTMLAAWLLNPGSRAVGLKGLALTELGQQMTDITELIGKGKSQITFDQVAVEEATPYACADADMTARLVPLQIEQLKEKSLYELFHDVEMPLVPVLVDMERHGVSFDPSALSEVRQHINESLARLEKEIYEHAGYEFNINSPGQLSEVLFEKLGLKKSKSTKTKQGHYSTAVNVLESLQGDHPIVELILEQRTLQKLLSTYVDQLPQAINPATGRIHTDFSQTAAETGRLSSLNPNLQNIPTRTELGRQIRRAFVAPPGEYLLACDYSQIELRVLAHLSEDQAMIDAFQRGEDIHAVTATRIFGVPLEAVSRDERRIAKIVNFGLLYGMSAFRLARETGLAYAEADEVLHNYFRSFPQIEAYLDGIVAQAAQSGYAETIMGRRRYFPELQNDRNSNQARAAERAAKNHPIQGSAAEIIKLAMIRIHAMLHDVGYQARMVLQVHDELLFEVPEEELEEVAQLVTDMMCDAMELKVPLKVDAKVGTNWDQMVPLEEFLE